MSERTWGTHKTVFDYIPPVTVSQGSRELEVMQALETIAAMHADKPIGAGLKGLLSTVHDGVIERATK